MLVGSAYLTAGASADAGVTLKYTNNGVGYTLPIQAARSSGIAIIPFSVPLSTNATFRFYTNSMTGASSYITNTVVWKL